MGDVIRGGCGAGDDSSAAAVSSLDDDDSSHSTSDDSADDSSHSLSLSVSSHRARDALLRTLVTLRRVGGRPFRFRPRLATGLTLRVVCARLCLSNACTLSVVHDVNTSEQNLHLCSVDCRRLRVLVDDDICTPKTAEVQS